MSSPSDPTGLAAHACGRGLEIQTPREGELLTIREAVALLETADGRQVYARLRLLEQGSETHLVELNSRVVSFMLKSEEDHDCSTRFSLDADGDLILEP